MSPPCPRVNLPTCPRSRPHALQRRQCAVAAGGEADERGRIILTEFDAGFGEDVHGGFPGLVDPLSRELGELRYPAAHVLAIGVELLALEHGIEDAEIRSGVGATTTGPLPAHGVRAEVGVYEGIPIPLGAFVPGLEEVLHEHGRGDHAHAVVLPAGLPELTHPGVDDRVAGAADLPSAQELLVRLPREFLEFLAERTIRGLGEVMDEVLREFAPADLRHVFVAAHDAKQPGGTHGVHDLER